MNWPLIARARHLRELDAQKCGYDRLFAQIDGKHASLQQRITDLEAGAVSETEAGVVIACLEGELAAQKKRADRLQARFDDAVGLDAPAVTAGAAWQERRETKLRYDK